MKTMSIAQEQIKRLMRELTTPCYKYDPEIGNLVVSKAYGLPCKDALKLFYDELMQNHAGCCINYASALAYRLLESNIPYAVVTSPEGEGIKVSISYVDRLNKNKHLICDIVEYVKGTSSIEECCAIPYEQFFAAVGYDTFFDVSNTDLPYVQLLLSGESNCFATPAE